MEIARDNGYGLAKQSLVPWILVTLAASAVLVVGVFMQVQETEKAWQLWARYTARLSFILFLASYIAAPLYELAKNPTTEWLRLNRRNSGISFGLAHTIHLGALIGFYVVSPIEAEMATVIVGGGAYVAMYFMLATSNDAALRRMGKINWRRLHKFGVHYLAFVFVYTYTSGYLAGYGKPLILIILIWAAIVLRLIVTVKTRREVV